ncbi:hypothetical protein ACFWUQ_02355 [Streptomyces sp. NPDC058662]|uniref:hypothetical protein n=1 Tax=Streptomyces sp. NPDC058662 TaxID=3346583 RepID=UPI003646B6C2
MGGRAWSSSVRDQWRALLPADAERIAEAQLDTEVEATGSLETAWCWRAVAEYVTPVADPVLAGVEGFPPRGRPSRANA